MRIAWAAVALLWLASAGQAQDYAIRLTRPDTVGTRYRATTARETAELKTASVGGKVVERTGQGSKLEFEGDVTVLAVDRHGRAAKVSIKLAKLDETIGGKRTALLRKGAVIVGAVEKQDEVFRVDGEPAPADLGEDLRGLVELATTDVSDDETLGTADRKKVGDRWPANRELLARDLSKRFGKIGARDFDITMTLESVVKVAGVGCLQVRCDIHLKKGPAGVPAPEGMAIGRVDARATIAYFLPVDFRKPCVRWRSALTGTVRMTSRPDPDGPEMTFDTWRSVTEVRTRSEIPAKKKP